MYAKKSRIFIPLGIALVGSLTVCAPREDATEEGRSADTLAADAPTPSGELEAEVAPVSVPAELLDTAWRLVEFATGEPVPDVIEITAEFRQGGIAGRSACNRYTGPAEIDLTAGTIKIGPVVSTKMACPPPQMESETRYLGALERASRIELEAGRLALHSEDAAGETTTLLFEPLGGS